MSHTLWNWEAQDTTEYPDFSSPEQLRKFLMRRISQQMNGQRPDRSGLTRSAASELDGPGRFRHMPRHDLHGTDIFNHWSG